MTSCVKTGWGLGLKVLPEAGKDSLGSMSHHGSSGKSLSLVLLSWVEVRLEPQQVGREARHCQRGKGLEGKVAYYPEIKSGCRRREKGTGTSVNLRVLGSELTFRARRSWLQRSMRAMSNSRLMALEVISGRCSV